MPAYVLDGAGRVDLPRRPLAVTATQEQLVSSFRRRRNPADRRVPCIRGRG